MKKKMKKKKEEEKKETKNKEEKKRRRKLKKFSTLPRHKTGEVMPYLDWRQNILRNKNYK